jgi:hypothetical protein
VRSYRNRQNSLAKRSYPDFLCRLIVLRMVEGDRRLA